MGKRGEGQAAWEEVGDHDGDWEGEEWASGRVVLVDREDASEVGAALQAGGVHTHRKGLRRVRRTRELERESLELVRER